MQAGPSVSGEQQPLLNPTRSISVGAPQDKAPKAPKRSKYLVSEDWWSLYLGIFYLVAFIIADLLGFSYNDEFSPQGWDHAPWNGMATAHWIALPILFVIMYLPLAFSAWIQGKPTIGALPGFLAIFILTWITKLIGSQNEVADVGLGAAIFSITTGLLITNVIGSPSWLLAGSRGEYYIKIGLVLMALKFQKILDVLLPTLFASYLVVPIVFFSMVWFGIRIQKIQSKTLVLLVAAATSVCGSSAAAAAASALEAPTEELTISIGITTVFTCVYMLAVPYFSIAVGLKDVVAGAWIGGSVDSTGPVVVSGYIVSDEAGETAAIVKMAQNVLVAFLAGGLAYYRLRHPEQFMSDMERGSIQGSDSKPAPKPSFGMLWDRFPKFVLGFLINSLVLSFVINPLIGDDRTDDIMDLSKSVSTAWETTAFVCIGLETNFKVLRKRMGGGAILILYLLGQTFDTLITFGAAYIAFGGSFGEINIET